MPRPCAHSTRSANLVLVDALERDRVDLDLQARRLRGLDAGQHLVELAPARDGAELVGIERVERDVDALHAAGRRARAAYFGKLRAVGGERELVERAAREMARQRAEQRHDAAPHQRLAAGEPQLAHAAGDEGAAQPVELLQREQVGLGQERHVFRHAVDAAEIAAVGDRDAQIGDRPPERIDEGRGGPMPEAIECESGRVVSHRYGSDTACNPSSRGRAS